MAAKRRSSRLLRGRNPRSPSPAASEQPTASNADTSLPSVAEADERQDTPEVVVPQSLQNPVSPKKSMFSFAAITQRTPRNKTPIKPSDEDMHPQLHHQTTAKTRDEARWLGFLSKGAQTEPFKKGSKIPAAPSTPSRIPNTTSRSLFTTPEFKFRCKEPSLELSPEARKIMDETREEAARIRAQMVAEAGNGTSSDVGALNGRRLAQAKGKVGRFSEVHMKEFKKLDSIANHASAFRADPNRFKPTDITKKSLKRSPSKAELDKEDLQPIVRPSSSKTRLPAFSKSQARPRSTIKLVNEKSEPPATVPNKRAKRRSEEDASSNRPQEVPATPKGDISRAQRGISRLPSVCTPTKASIARSQSAKHIQPFQSAIPSLARTPTSARTLTSFARTPMHNFSPSKTKATIKEGVRQISDSFKQKVGVKGILRTPQRQFSNDPLKIAAGTHAATPDRLRIGLHLEKALPAIPTTEPVLKIKRVDFTASTVTMAEKGDLPSPTRRPENGTVTIRQDDPVVYPSLQEDLASPTASPSRRLTLSGLPIPGSFTFRSDQQISFGPATGGTIRKVRSSNASEIGQDAGKKRKLEVVNEVMESDKENDAASTAVTEDGRSTKRARMGPVVTPKTLHKTPRKTPIKTPLKTPRGNDQKRGSGMSNSRLNFLAMPKRRDV